MSKSSESPPATVRRTARPILALVGFVVVGALGFLVVWSQSADPDQLWQSAQVALKEGRIRDAANDVDRLARRREPLPRDWLLRGQVAVAQKRADDAVYALKQVDEANPAAPHAWLLLGQVEIRRNRAKDAEEALLKAIQLDPGLIQAHRELIFIYGMQLRREALNEQFTALSEIADLSYDNVFHWSLLRNCLWEPGEVAETLSEFLEADPTDRQSRLALAENYRRLGLFEEAEEALAALPDEDIDALAGRTMLAMDRHQEDLAEELLAKGPADDPRLARIRGRLALARRDGPRAVHYFQIAYKDEPGDRDTVFGLINALELVGDDSAAAPLRQTAKNLETFNTLMQRITAFGGRNDSGLLKEMAAACEALGFIPEARAWYKVVISRDPLDAEAQQALFRLDARRKAHHPPRVSANVARRPS